MTAKNIVVISTSLRDGSNTEALADEFIKGAEEAGNHVEKISLKRKKIGFCIGCLACQKTGRCVIKDDADEIAGKVSKADVVVFATPVYYYCMSGQMKALIDRMNPLFPKENSFEDVYLLTAGSDDDEHFADRTIAGLQGWIDCFPQCELKGTINACGISDIGDIEENGKKFLEAAYEMGKNA